MGANVGASALRFALAFPSARIRCWEPGRRTFHYLQANTAPFPQIECHRYGLFDTHAQLQLGMLRIETPQLANV